MADTSSEKTTQEVRGAPENDDGVISSKTLRPITIYDAVAGRAGVNGFLTQEQRQSENVLPIAPEEVLASRSMISNNLIEQEYDASAALPESQKLPDSGMLRAIHAYVSDFYASSTEDGGTFDFRSLDETALIAIGILLEEAVKETLGQNGDMVFVEPEGLDQGLDETPLTRHQVKGKVKLLPPSDSDEEEEVEEEEEDSLGEEESPTKKQRR